MVKNPPASVGDPGSIPGLEREGQPTLVFLLGESHGQRSLVSYNPWHYKDLDMT